MFRKFFHAFSNIKSIVVGYRYYRIRQGIDTIILVSILLPSLVAVGSLEHLGMIIRHTGYRKKINEKGYHNLIITNW